MKAEREFYLKKMYPFRKEIITRYTRLKAYDEMLDMRKERLVIYVESK